MKTNRFQTLSKVYWFSRMRQSEEMETEAIPVGNNLETAVETRCLKELCGDGSAFMGLDDQSLLIRLTEKDDNDYVDLDVKFPRSRVSFGSDGQKIDSVLHVDREKTSYISPKELLSKIVVPSTYLVPAAVVEHTTIIVIPTIRDTAASYQASSDTLANGTSRMTAATRPTNSLVPTTLIAPPITMVSIIETTASMMSTTSVTREITVAPPACVVSTMVSNRTSGPSTPMQDAPTGRVGQYKSKMDMPRVSTYIWTNAVDLNRKGSFGVSNIHLRAFKGKPGVPGKKSISTLNSAYLGEFAGNYQFGGQTLKWVIKKDWPNGSLNTWLDKDPKRRIIDENAARYISIRLLEAVQYLHSKGFYHGNIHPNNIYINDKGQSVLGGLRATIKYNGMRSLRADKEYDFKFFSPELLTGPYMNRSSDIFSVGSVTFFIISGRYPFRTKEDLVNMEYEPEYSLDFSLHAEMFLYQCLEKKAENRLKLGPYLNNVYRDRWFAKMEEDDVTNQSSPSPLIQTMNKMKKEML